MFAMSTATAPARRRAVTSRSRCGHSGSFPPARTPGYYRRSNVPCRYRRVFSIRSTRYSQRERKQGCRRRGGALRDRLARLEAACRDAALIWPAEVVLELIHEYERYAEHDARFAPDQFAELAGELLIRCDAIRNNTGAVPQLLIRGTAADHWIDLGSARFIGVGCGVRPARRQAIVSAYLQDANSGSMVAVSREFPDPAPDAAEEPKPFWQLARTPVVKGDSSRNSGRGNCSQAAAGAHRSSPRPWPGEGDGEPPELRVGEPAAAGTRRVLRRHSRPTRCPSPGVIAAAPGRRGFPRLHGLQSGIGGLSPRNADDRSGRRRCAQRTRDRAPSLHQPRRPGRGTDSWRDLRLLRGSYDLSPVQCGFWAIHSPWNP